MVLLRCKYCIVMLSLLLFSLVVILLSLLSLTHTSAFGKHVRLVQQRMVQRAIGVRRFPRPILSSSIQSVSLTRHCSRSDSIPVTSSKNWSNVHDVGEGLKYLRPTQHTVQVLR